MLEPFERIDVANPLSLPERCEGDTMRSLSIAQGRSLADPSADPFDDSIGHPIDRKASAAHHAVDALADQALTGVGKLSGSLHVAVNHTADAVSNAADWISHVPAQIGQKKTRLAQVTFATIKSHPFATLGSAIAVGYVVGRLARR
jgi:ElaB/YqjD/DUF883 family membrane-anchored ribosome-binding protein